MAYSQEQTPFTSYGSGYLNFSSYSAPVGRLYFDTPAGRSTCSGTVVGPNIVLTAAHCVVDSDTGNFYRNWLFVPKQYQNVTSRELDGAGRRGMAVSGHQVCEISRALAAWASCPWITRSSS